MLGQVPRGWAAFRAIQALYPRAINSAVLGSVARGRLVWRALERLVSLPAPRQGGRSPCGWATVKR